MAWTRVAVVATDTRGQSEDVRMAEVMIGLADGHQGVRSWAQ